MTDLHPPLKAAAAPGQRISLVLAIVVHLLLAAFLIYGVHWQTKPQEAVEVELISALPPAVPPAPTFVPEPPPPEPKSEPKPLPPPPKPDIALKEPKTKPPKEVPKPIPPIPIPKPKEIPRDPPKEVSKNDRYKEELRRETERLDRNKLAAALDKDIAGVKAAQAASAKEKSSADWVARIRSKIRGNTVLPPEIKGNPEAEFIVTLMPSGEVLSLQLAKSSGHAALDSAIERAIRKSDPLPKPEKSDVFQRELRLKYRPRDD